MKDFENKHNEFFESIYSEYLGRPITKELDLEIFSKIYTKGRTDTLSELSFVRDALASITAAIPDSDCPEDDDANGWMEFAIKRRKIARECLSRLDALTGDGEDKFNNEGETK